MSYKAPCLKDLRAIAEHLKKSYQGTNPHRLSFIALYDQLVEQTAKGTHLPENIINILIGALVFEMAYIKYDEYHGASPKKNVGWIWSSGSELYTLIKEKLHINKKDNKLSYEERLFYLNEFYKYIDKVYPDSALQELKQHKKLTDNRKTLVWPTKAVLSEQIHKSLEPVLKKNSDNLYNLVHGVPLLNALLKNLKKLEDEYSANSSNPKNPKRLETVNFIKFILQSYHGTDPSAISWHACVGAVLVALLRIENEYKVFSPTRSALFRECLQALNQESMKKITIDDKIKWLRSLSAHLVSVSDNPEHYAAILKQVCADTKNQKLDTAVLSEQIKKFQARIESYLVELEAAKKAPSNTRYAISTGTSYFVQYAAGPVAIQAAKNTIIGGLSIGGFFAAGPVGSAIFGAAGALLMSGLGRLVTEGIVNAATANLFAWVLGRIGDSVGDATATVVTYPFSATPKGLTDMRMKLKPEDDQAFVRMVNTLLELDTVSDNDKLHMRKVLGLEEGEKLLPLKHSAYGVDAERNAVLENGYVCVRIEDSGERRIVESADPNPQPEVVVRRFF
ncbi:hypothetical protein AQUSIP_26230 [Aquicella siphonis]|uniref:Uncharacterized protein n=1 Tax=Aquicella siphonis TaxID=254247 RepID=A0A5E4PM59_9COXI|nr:hypothetical protein [Aquicella siphonis]VVC77296.1 hypothetical protein AQUSIP_26230 [Aquicella siphonis]